MSLFRELQRRNVIRVATAYVVTAWLVIQVVETIFPAFGFGDEAIRLAVIVLGIGFVPAVIGAWVFEWTPEGLRRDADAPKDGRPTGARNLDRAIVVVLALGIVYFAFDKFVLAPERAAEREAEVAEQAVAEATKGFYGDRSIAVLPFDNLSADPEQVYFVDGVAEEILNLLARIGELRVISRSSSFSFRGQNLEIPEIAERLDVGHVLEGSVRRAGDRVRVTAQLIEARTDTHLWSKTYERELDDVFLIQDEIAADVARNLEIKLLDPPRSRKVDPDVLALTEQARRIWEERRQGPEGPRLYALLSRALEIDPDYVPALEMMNLTNWVLKAQELITEDEHRAREELLRRRILELDPDNGFVIAGEAWDLMIAGEYEAAAEKYSIALETDSRTPETVRGAATLAQHLGKIDVAIRLLEYRLGIDPLCHQCREILSRSLMYAGEYERAIEIRERYLLSAGGGEEDYALMLLMTGQAQRVAEMFPLGEEAWRVMDESVAAAYDLVYQAMAAHSLGNVAEAEEFHRQAEGSLAGMIAGGTHPLYIRNVQYALARAAAWMGKADRAFELLMLFADTDFNFPRSEIFSPIWNEIRDDPRWLDYRAAQGLSPERVEAIEFDPPLPE